MICQTKFLAKSPRGLAFSGTFGTQENFRRPAGYPTGMSDIIYFIVSFYRTYIGHPVCGKNTVSYYLI